MALPVRRKMIPAGNSNNPGAALNTGELWFVVHETGNLAAGATAAMHATFVHQGGGAANVSFHLTVDQREAWQMLRFNVIGYHAADGCNNRQTDYGCFRGIAIETCVNDGNKYAAITRENLVELMARICIGDPAFDYGGRKPSDFSPDRIATHQKVSDTNKYCPTYMLRDGYAATLPARVKAKIAELKGQDTPVPGSPYAAPSFIAEAEGGVADFIALANGARLIRTRDVEVRTVRETKRLKWATPTSPVIGPNIAKDQAFSVDYLIINKDGSKYWYTKYGTRVAFSDTGPSSG